MKERPILFSAPMVRALLDGTKTQTRRVVKGFTEKQMRPFTRPNGTQWLTSHDRDPLGLLVTSPYGYPGDRLWVRETWAYRGGDEYLYQQEPQCVQYRATDQYAYSLTGEPRGDRRWRPSIHMPRWASRLTLTITDVRVERLQGISTGDAIAEGCSGSGSTHDPDDFHDPVGQYRELWDSLNAARGYGWDANPWVWVVSFTASHGAST